MTWVALQGSIYSQESAESHLHSVSTLEQSPIVSVTDTHKAFYCRECDQVILIDHAPIWDDVTTLKSDLLPQIDIITGGFPCQDLSIAGYGAGLEGKRSGLFFEIIRLTCELRPSFVFLENVPAISFRGLERVCMEFTKIGYDCRWTTISARSIGASHARERWFMLSHPHRFGLEAVESNDKKQKKRQRMRSRIILPTIRQEDINQNVRENDGVRIPVDRIRCLGNSVVPLQVKAAFETLLNLKKSKLIKEFVKNDETTVQQDFNFTLQND